MEEGKLQPESMKKVKVVQVKMRSYLLNLVSR